MHTTTATHTTHTTTHTTGDRVAGTYLEGETLVTDYTGTVTHVDNGPHTTTVTLTFHGGRTHTYTTDTNGHSVDIGMTPVPCPGPDTPRAPLTLRKRTHNRNR